MSKCLFCNIVNGDIPAKKVHEDDRLIAFEDINPQAPMHVLVVPRAHIATLNDMLAEHDALVGSMVRLGSTIAAERGYSAGGFRTVFNCNRDAGQTVFHLHLHVLGGRRLGWPPG
jgi:histidine triad (HIT) family protein